MVRKRSVHLMFAYCGNQWPMGTGLVNSSSSVGPLRPSGSSGTMKRSPTKEYIRSLQAYSTHISDHDKIIFKALYLDQDVYAPMPGFNLYYNSCTGLEK